MALTTIKAAVQKKNGISVEAQSGEFKVLIDQPIESGGTNTGMNPAQLLLCALGGCQAISTASSASKYGVNIEDLSIELEGDIDPNASMSSSNSRPGYQDIRFNVHIKTNSPESKVIELIRSVEKKYPMGDSIANGVPIEPAEITIERQVQYTGV
ncbi:OsmC family protein [Clostridium sp. JN-1]|uniref:OsmC family protein n=1 Tax=Clostridium sp. JN-1 TaxID=2483110 RepID=UPI000F0BB23F|nr:OsmC family protein [Clostridium sp. JN-1]